MLGDASSLKKTNLLYFCYCYFASETDIPVQINCVLQLYLIEHLPFSTGLLMRGIPVLCCRLIDRFNVAVPYLQIGTDNRHHQRGPMF